MMIPDQVVTDEYAVYHRDCIEAMRELPSDSVHFTCSSPPFQSLYTYSASERDIGNCRTDDEFYAHFGFLVPELYRVTKPGRLCSLHVMNLPTSKAKHGYIGITDFRGNVIRSMQDAGWIFHSEVTIWRDPVTAMHRTKALGLLYKQLRKDSAMSRQGIPDYLCTFRKPGVNDEPIEHVADDFPVQLWQRFASPVWMDIQESNTLQFRSVREEKDERHLCALNLEVIRRAIMLWSNPGDVVLDPFGGIGSTGFVALQEGRRALLTELKESYYRQAVANLQAAIAERHPSLFAEAVAP